MSIPINNIKYKKEGYNNEKKKRVFIASSLSCALLLLSAANTEANSANKDSQDQTKKEHVDKAQQKEKRNVNDKDKNTPGPDDIGKTVKLQSVLYLNTIKRQIFYKIYNSTLSMIQHMTRMSYLSKTRVNSFKFKV